MSVLEEKRSHLWRLSDFLCTYRFWVIANFLIALYGCKFLSLPETIAVTYQVYFQNPSIGIVIVILNLGTITGVVFAWLFSRSKSVYPLSILGIVAILCLVVHQLNYDILVNWVSIFILFMLSTAVLLLAAAYIGHASKKTSTFIILFGFIYALMNVIAFSLNFRIQTNLFSFKEIAITSVLAIVIATILLLFSNKNIFYSLPKRALIHTDDNQILFKWTWADLVSSYRFWGLLLFIVLISPSSYCIDYFLPTGFNSNIGKYNFPLLSELKEFATIISCFIAILISYIAYKYDMYKSIIILSLLLIGVIVISIMKLNIYAFVFIIFLYKCIYYAIFLLVFASIAKVVNDVCDIVAIFSTILAFTLIVGNLSGVAISFITDLKQEVEFYPSKYPLFFREIPLNYLTCGFFILLVVIALVILTTINSKLFSESPRNRHIISSVSSSFSTVATFILTLIPFLSLFWYARVHNQIRHYTQSSSLLTPTGAVLCILFIPFSSLFILTILYDVTNEITENKTKTGWGFILLSIFFPPAAAAILQTRLNKFYYQNMKVSD